MDVPHDKGDTGGQRSQSPIRRYLPAVGIRRVYDAFALAVGDAVVKVESAANFTLACTPIVSAELTVIALVGTPSVRAICSPVARPASFGMKI